MAKYKMRLDFPNLGPEQVVEVPPYGAFKNGEEVELEVPREEAERLATAFGLVVTTEGGNEVKGKLPEPQEETDLRPVVEVPGEDKEGQEGGES